MLHRAGGKSPALFIATPTYGDLSAGYTYALAHSTVALEREGIAFELAIYSGDCHVDDARNRLVRDFLETSCTHFLFIDADLRWEASDLIKLLRHNVDVVGGTYPLKQDDEKFPVMMSGDGTKDEYGLIEVDALPTGFLLIQRHVFEKLYKEAPKFPPKSDHRSLLPLIFERTIHDGMRWGGDYTFCRKWKEHGKIYLDPTIWFEHFGENVWSGRYETFQKRQDGVKLPGLDDIANNCECPNTMVELVREWGNSSFSASSDMLSALMMIARNASGDIVEFGSGLSTLVLACSTEHTVHAHEHDPVWRDKLLKIIEEKDIDNIKIHYSLL
jgi:hypothetical protein